MKIKEKLCNFLSPGNRDMIERLKKQGEFSLVSICIIIGIIMFVVLAILAINFIIFSALVYLAAWIFGLEFNWTGVLIMYAIYLSLNLILPKDL